MVDLPELHRRGARVGTAEAGRLDPGDRLRLVRRARSGSGGLMAITLTLSQAAVVARALVDAEHYRRDSAAVWCADCAAAPEGCCPYHLLISPGRVSPGPGRRACARREPSRPLRRSPTTTGLGPIPLRTGEDLDHQPYDGRQPASGTSAAGDRCGRPPGELRRVWRTPGEPDPRRRPRCPLRQGHAPRADQRPGSDRGPAAARRVHRCHDRRRPPDDAR